jgi:photosystem II stability/assembly factor-like uncharacterized protein/surface antigen
MIMKTKGYWRRKWSIEILIGLFAIFFASQSLAQDNTWYFPYIKIGQGWKTTLSITNLDDKKVNLNIAFYDENGNLLGEALDAENLKLGETREINGRIIPSEAKTLKIEKDGNIKGICLLATEDGRKSEVIPLIKEKTRQLDFPTLTQDDIYYKTITILNPNPTPTGIYVYALDKDGFEIDHMSLPTLSPNESRNFLVNDLFSAQTLNRLSTVRVTAEKDIIGLQLLDYPGGDIVGLPALTTTSKEWTFPIFTKANGLEFWTRVGINNPGNSIAFITAEAFDESNNPLGIFEYAHIPPGVTYFIKTANIRGTIPNQAIILKVTSGHSVSGYEVIGVVNGYGLAAILGIPDENQTIAGFEITTSKDGSVLDVYPKVKTRDGSVKSTTGSLESAEYETRHQSIIEIKMKSFPQAETISPSSLAIGADNCGGVSSPGNPFPCCPNGGNCTWWAWHKAKSIWGVDFPAKGNALSWADVARSNGYLVTSTPAINTIAVNTTQTADGVVYGHVAWVEEISGDKLRVSEMNCCSMCGYGPNYDKWYSISYFDGGFIYVTTCIATVSSDRWKGEYFNNISLSGSPLMVKDDGNGALNFDWGTGSPGSDCGIGTDNFSVRWTRVVYFDLGTYRFTVTSDDGVRVYVDDALKLDKWFDQPPTMYTVDVSLTAGNHTIRMEYYERGGGAVARLSWQVVSTTTCIATVSSDRWKGEYFNNISLSGSPLMVKDDGNGALNFDWGAGSPGSDCGISVDNFSVRWTRAVYFDVGTYRFTVTSDDGVRFYVDDALKLDKWFDQPPTTYTVDVWLTAGNHTVRMEYYERGGGAVARLSWQVVSTTTCIATVSSDHWKGEYYNGVSLSGGPLMVRDDGNGFLNFDWGTGSPSSDCGIGADNFSVRWTRAVYFDAGTYRFTVTSDDGFRLYVGDALKLDKWFDQPPTTYTVDVSLTAGNHNLKMEYYERGGGAVARLSWEKVSTGDNQWVSIGPEGGPVEVLAIDPQTPSILYAGTFGGGIFKSTNGGTNWTAVNTGLTNLEVTSLAIDPQTPNTLYAGTGSGIFKSTDGGANWTAINTGLTITRIYGLAIDPQTPNTLYAGTVNAGVFKSTDAGGNWTAINTGLTTTSVMALAIDPQRPNILYAAQMYAGVFKSTDGGANWTPINTGMTSNNVNALAIDPQTPNILYAGTWDCVGGVFKSTDGGANWAAMNTGLTTIGISYLAIDSQTPNTLYAGTWYGLFKSTNAGANWTAMNTGLTSLGVDLLAIDPRTPNTLYAGTWYGIHKSTNGGVNWAAINTGLMSTSVNALAIHPQTPDTLYAGASGRVFKSTNGGANWTAANIVWGVYEFAINPQMPDTVYAATTGGVLKSTNGGANWTAMNTGLTNFDVHALAIDAQTPNTLYAGTSEQISGAGVFKSTNAGVDWIAINTGMTNTNVTALAIDPQTPNILYVGTLGGGIFKSTNGGANWTAVNTGLTNTYVHALAIDPPIPNTLYAGTDTGVFKSINGGASWTAVNTGITNTYVTALAIDPQTPGILYAGTWYDGVFKSTNGGNTWNAIGLSYYWVRSLAIDPQTPDTLYAGTSGGGVFKIRQDTFIFSDVSINHWAYNLHKFHL